MARICPHCSNLQPCATHYRRPFEGARRTTNLYGTARWQKERSLFLSLFPLCFVCREPSTVVDHRVPHQGDEAAFWNQANWQALCRYCHNAKTGRETRRGGGSDFLNGSGSQERWATLPRPGTGLKVSKGA
jgi:5-methylcytosine-specific restriction protein A